MRFIYTELRVDPVKIELKFASHALQINNPTLHMVVFLTYFFCFLKRTVFNCYSKFFFFPVSPGACGYHNAIFSPGCKYYILECLGPGFPSVHLYSAAGPTHLAVLQNNSALAVSNYIS